MVILYYVISTTVVCWDPILPSNGWMRKDLKCTLSWAASWYSWKRIYSTGTLRISEAIYKTYHVFLLVNSLDTKHCIARTNILYHQCFRSSLSNVYSRKYDHAEVCVCFRIRRYNPGRYELPYNSYTFRWGSFDPEFFLEWPFVKTHYFQFECDWFACLKFSLNL